MGDGVTCVAWSGNFKSECEMSAWFVKFLGGFLPFITKPFPEWLGKVLWCSGIALLVCITWNKFTKPTTLTEQKAEKIVNYTDSRKVMFGCMRIEAMNSWKH